MLGFRTINGDKPGSYAGADDGSTLLRQIEAGDFSLPTFELFDAFTDNPYFHLWREMYARFPDARYILTVRDEKPWIDSCVRFYRNRRIRPMRLWMFGKYANPSQGCREPASLARRVSRPQRCGACAFRIPAGPAPRTGHHSPSRAGTSCAISWACRSRPSPCRTRTRRNRTHSGARHGVGCGARSVPSTHLPDD